MWSREEAGYTRAIDLFRAVALARDGHVTPAEFYKGLRGSTLGFNQRESDLVFASIDKDGSGTLEPSELKAKLHEFVETDRAPLNFMFCGSSERVALPPEHPSLQTHRDQSSFRRTFGVAAEGGGDMCPV